MAESKIPAVVIGTALALGVVGAAAVAASYSPVCPDSLKAHFITAVSDTNKDLKPGQQISKATITALTNDGHACAFSTP